MININPELPKWTTSIKDELGVSGNRPWLAIAFTGNDFMPGVLEAAHEAAQTWAGTAIVWAERNLCYVPHMGLGCMKNFNVMRACEVGVDYLLMLENDILLHPDTPNRLAQAGKDITAPFYDQTGLADAPHRIMSPQFVLEGNAAIPIAWQTEIDIQYPPSERVVDKGGSLIRLDWAVMACLMFQTTVFGWDKLGEKPFSELPIDRNDEYNCLFWRRRGCEVWLDLNATVQLLRPPSTPTQIRDLMRNGARVRNA